MKLPAVLIGLLLCASVVAQGKVQKQVRFQTEPADAVVFVYDVGSGKLEEARTQAQGNLLILDSEKGLALKFGLRPRLLTPPADLKPVANDTRTFALSEPIIFSKENVQDIAKSGVWPPAGQPPLQLQFSEAEKQFYQKDLLASRLIWIVPSGLLVLVLLFGGLRYYEVRVRRPRAQLLEMETRREEFNQLVNSQRLERKDNNLGSVMGGYVLEKFLGAGGMARVYRAVPEQTLDVKECVAIKLMSDASATSEEFRKRFFREADVGRNLTHPSVVRIEDYGDAEGTLYLVMEFVQGQNLRDKIAPEGLSGAEVWGYCKPICEALQYVHQRGVIHRDLKPENIMVTPGGRLVIMDFGLAKRHDHSMLTGSGDILGTPAYMSPEQIQGNPPPDARSDQYAIGVLVYELVTGKLPFHGTTDPVQLLMKHIGSEPFRASELRPNLPPQLDQVLLRMLSKNPDDRYPDMAACAAALQPALSKLS